MLEEKLLTFSQAAATLPRLNGKKVHTSSVWRWSRKGIKGVFLEVRRIGGRFVTSVEALDRFTKTLADLPPGSGAAPVSPSNTTKRPRSQAQRQRDIEAARAKLTAAGVKVAARGGAAGAAR